jgi:hypothetical protein
VQPGAFPPWPPAVRFLATTNPARLPCEPDGLAFAQVNTGQQWAAQPGVTPTWRGILAAARGVAQPGSALQWGCRGRAFESLRPD